MKYDPRTVQELKTTAESLINVARQLNSIADQMEDQALGQNKMKTILLRWNQRQYDAIDLVVRMGEWAAIMAPEQLLAHKQNRPSKYETAKKETVNDESLKLAKKTPNADLPPPKPRGRPRRKGA